MGRRTLNTTKAFSAVDIYNGGGSPVAVLSYTPTTAIDNFFTPMVLLEGLNGAAANLTYEVWLQYAKGAYFKVYDSGATAKDPNASTMHQWNYPDGIICYNRGAIVGIQISVSSSNSNDTSISGYAYLLNANRNDPYLVETTAVGGSTTTVIMNSATGLDENNDWYNGHYVEIEDATTGTAQVRHITDQATTTLTFTPALSFSLAGGDPVRILKTCSSDIGTVNGAQPMGTGDIKTAIEAAGSTLDTLDDLTKAAGAGDLAAIKTAVDAIDTLTEASGNGDLAAILTDTAEIANIPKFAFKDTLIEAGSTDTSIIIDTGGLGNLNSFQGRTVECKRNATGFLSYRNVASSTSPSGNNVTLVLNDALEYTPTAGVDSLSFLPEYADPEIKTLIDTIAAGTGSGAITFTYTLYTDEALETGPINDATVWVSTDISGATVIASGVTDASGEVVFYLDAGTYYFWRQCAGYNFSNPDLEAVS